MTLKTILLASLLAVSGTVNATIIDATIDALNDGFTDTLTGITYWDIDKFYGLDVPSIEGAGYVLETYSNAVTLYTNIVNGYPNSAERDLIFDIMGSLESYIWTRWDDGIANVAGDGGYLYTSDTNPTANIFNNVYTYTDRTFGALVQSRQRQTPVPVPATLALFGLGLAGLGWSRRKKV